MSHASWDIDICECAAREGSVREGEAPAEPRTRTDLGGNVREGEAPAEPGVSRLALLSRPELRQGMVGSGEPTYEMPGTCVGYYPGRDTRNNVISILDNLALQDPGHVALRWVDSELLRRWTGACDEPLIHTQLTREELLRLGASAASGLLDLGIKMGDTVILFVPMSLPLYVLMTALQRIGAIPVFLDSWARRDELGVCAQVVKPVAMISFQAAFELTADLPALSCIPLKISVGPIERECDASYEQLIENPGFAPLVSVESEHTALVTFTTGSSGTPKGANRTHRFLADQHDALKKCLSYEAQDVDLPVFPIFSLNNLATGVTTVIPAIDLGRPAANDPRILLAQLEACQVNCCTLSPSLFNRLSQYCLTTNYRLRSLRRIVTGGAPISRDHLTDMHAAAPAAKIVILYGSTEVEPMTEIDSRDVLRGTIVRRTSKSVASAMTDLEVRPTPTFEEDSEWVEEGVNVGRFVTGLQYRLLKIHPGPITVSRAADWSCLEVAEGEVGEVVVAGRQVCSGYYNNPEAFATSKIRDEHNVVWHRTGDLGRCDGDGNLWIVGRVHNVIRRNGQYVFPVRAEMVLPKLQFVKAAAYLGIPDAVLGERTVCVIVPNVPLEQVDEATLRIWTNEVQRIMRKNNMPVDGVVLRSEIPLDPRHHSKVEYAALREILLRTGEGEAPAEP